MSDERPMSTGTFIVMTVLIVLGGLFVLRWIFSTVAFLLNTLLVVAVVAAGVFLYLRLRGDRS